MDDRPVTIWLKRKVAADAALNFVSGALISTGGIVVVAFSFGAAYALVWFVSQVGVTWMSALFFNERVEVPATVQLAGAAMLVGGLFIGNARLRREYSRRPTGHRTASDLEAHSSEALVHLLAYPGVSSDRLSDALFTGPRLMTIGLDHLRKAERLWRLDVEACSRLLCVLASYSAKVPLSDLIPASGISNAKQVVPQLRDVDGVVFLNSEPPGASLTADLRHVLLSIAPSRPDGDQVVPSTAPGSTTNLHELLGVSENAPLEEFEAAYRKWIRDTARTHPPGTRRSLDQNAEAVKTAYEAFLRQHQKRQSEERQPGVQRVWEQYRQSEK